VDRYAWPQAPILADVPPTARLGLSFDPARLAEDLARVNDRVWARLKDEDRVGSDTAQLGWRSLVLRSPGGDAARTDPGGPGLADFADTALLAETPYIAGVLARIPAPLRGVRLLALRPGAHSPVHVDPEYSFPWGALRLHVPVVVLPEARLDIAGQSHVWEPGSFWYADFTRPHQVSNEGTGTRVHLVIDTHVTPELLALFPAEFRRPDVVAEVLFDRTESPSPRETCDDLRCRFSLGSGDGSDGPSVGRIDWYDGRLALFFDDEPAYRLVHVGNDEFRFAGWTMQRTIQIETGATGHTVTMFMRTGGQTHAVARPASPLASAAGRT
jgi:hypothetical protein